MFYATFARLRDKISMLTDIFFPDEKSPCPKTEAVP